jgi:hypothetical protein
LPGSESPFCTLAVAVEKAIRVGDALMRFDIDVPLSQKIPVGGSDRGPGAAAAASSSVRSHPLPSRTVDSGGTFDGGVIGSAQYGDGDLNGHAGSDQVTFGSRASVDVYVAPPAPSTGWISSDIS